MVFQFDTAFQNKAMAVETVTFMRDADGLWRAVGYFVSLSERGTMGLADPLLLEDRSLAGRRKESCRIHREMVDAWPSFEQTPTDNV